MAPSEAALAEQLLTLLQVRPSKRGAKPGAKPVARKQTKQTSGRADDALRAAVRKGLPFASVLAVLAQLDLPQAALAKLLSIPTRTLARRQAARWLQPDESDRLYRVARIVTLANSALGTTLAARTWLTSTNRALGGESPLNLLDTEIGARRVEEVLERINYGIFS